MPERDVMIGIAELRAGAAPATPIAAARVIQVNTSPGGVPKLPVTEAFVHTLGLEGDDHHDVAGHGGPLRAVSLFGMEAILRIAADGNPIAPGTTGENVTTEGIELGTLPYGTQLGIGDDLIVELTEPANPCKTIQHNFTDGRFARMSVKTHPLDTRLYARVVREGTIRPGDPIAVLSLREPLAEG